MAWVADSSAALDDREVTDVRGGTPLVAHPDGGWWGLAHTVDMHDTCQHPILNYVIGRYRTTYHHYTHAFASVDTEHMRSPCTAPVASIEYPCGLVVLDDGEALVSMGLQDVSTVLVWAPCDHWATPDAPRSTWRRTASPTATAHSDRAARTDGHANVVPQYIVKNESRIIERQLATVAPILDAYCIATRGAPTTRSRASTPTLSARASRSRRPTPVCELWTQP